MHRQQLGTISITNSRPATAGTLGEGGHRQAQRTSFNTLDNWGHKTPTQSKRKRNRKEKIKGSWARTCTIHSVTYISIQKYCPFLLSTLPSAYSSSSSTEVLGRGLFRLTGLSFYSQENQSNHVILDTLVAWGCDRSIVFDEIRGSCSLCLQKLSAFFSFLLPFWLLLGNMNVEKQFFTRTVWIKPFTKNTQKSKKCDVLWPVSYTHLTLPTRRWV